MKRILTTITTTLLFAAAFVSCDDDNHAEASCTYYVNKDSIAYSDLTDATYDSIIRACIDSVGISGYYFTESAETDINSVEYAVILCNTQAVERFDKAIKAIPSLSSFTNRLYQLNTHYFDSLGIKSPSQIGLDRFTVNANLWNFSYHVKVKTEKVSIQ